MPWPRFSCEAASPASKPSTASAAWKCRCAIASPARHRWLIVIAAALSLCAAAPSEAAGVAGLSPCLAHDGTGPHAGDRQLISMSLGICAVILVLVNRKRLRSVPGASWWIGALLVRQAGWTVALLNAIWRFDPGDLAETAFLTLSTALIALAAWKTLVFQERKGVGE